MRIFNYLKEVKQSIKELKNGFPVNLQGDFSEFMFQMSDGGHYWALDINLLLNYNLFLPPFRTQNFLISQYTLDVFQNAVSTFENSNDAESIAVLEKTRNALNAINSGFCIRILPVDQNYLIQNGFDINNSYHIQIGSFIKERNRIQSQIKWKKVVYVISSEDDLGIKTLQACGLDFYPVHTSN